MNKKNLDLLMPIFQVVGYDLKTLPYVINAAEEFQKSCLVYSKISEETLCLCIRRLLIGAVDKPSSFGAVSVTDSSGKIKPLAVLLNDIFLDVSQLHTGITLDERRLLALDRMRLLVGKSNVPSLHLLLRVMGNLMILAVEND